MQPTHLQYKYRKEVKFNEQQIKALNTLEKMGINVSQFIRQATKEKLEKEWKEMYELHKKHTGVTAPF